MFGLDTDTIRNIKDCFAKIPQIQKVLLYGSRAKGNYKNGSDIDLTLIGKNLNPDDSIYPLKEELDKLYLPYTFDISILSKLDKLEFINHILKVGKTFYQKETNELPAGWQQKKLGDVAFISSGNSAPQNKELFENGSFPFIRTSDVGKIKKGCINSTFDYLNKNGIKKLRLFKKGTILLPKSGASTFLNHRVITEIDSYVSSHLATIKPDEKNIDRFIWYFLITIDAKNLIQDIAYPSLKLSDIKNIQIPIPPLAEQKRIVAVLDKTFTAIDKIKNNTEKNLANTKELWQSYLQQSFNNPKKNWQQKKLGDVCEKLFAGGDVPKNNFSKTKTDKFNIPIFSNGIKDNGLYGFTNIKKVNKPSITISARGTIGYSVLRKETFYPIIRLIVLSPKEKLLDLFFLKYVLNNISFLNSGTAIPQLTVPMIKEYQITFPPLAEQKQITERLDYLSQKTTALQETYCKKIQNLIELKNSLLQQAFTGQL